MQPGCDFRLAAVRLLLDIKSESRVCHRMNITRVAVRSVRCSCGFQPLKIVRALKDLRSRSCAELNFASHTYCFTKVVEIADRGTSHIHPPQDMSVYQCRRNFGKLPAGGATVFKKLQSFQRQRATGLAREKFCELALAIKSSRKPCPPPRNFMSPLNNSAETFEKCHPKPPAYLNTTHKIQALLKIEDA